MTGGSGITPVQDVEAAAGSDLQPAVLRRHEPDVVHGERELRLLLEVVPRDQELHGAAGAAAGHKQKVVLRDSRHRRPELCDKHRVALLAPLLVLPLPQLQQHPPSAPVPAEKHGPTQRRAQILQTAHERHARGRHSRCPPLVSVNGHAGMAAVCVHRALVGEPQRMGVRFDTIVDCSCMLRCAWVRCQRLTRVRSTAAELRCHADIVAASFPREVSTGAVGRTHPRLSRRRRRARRRG